MQSTGERAGRVLVVGTAPPTRCGIGSYTTNVTTAMRGAGVDASILRVVPDGDPLDGEGTWVAGRWCHGAARGLDDAIDLANTFDAVLVQHEFGIFPGRDGEEVIEFVDGLDVPLSTVLHTVTPRPSRRQEAILDRLMDRSDALILHTECGRERLIEQYERAVDRVEVVPHGASSRTSTHRPPGSRPSMLSWGLIGPGKGIEYAIEAVAILRRLGLDVDYVIAGITHPTVLRADGDVYRHQLLTIARSLGVSDLIRFDDRYRSADEQATLIETASVVVLPYDSREQITSGVLVEAIAAGRPVIATGFPHARELEPTGAVAVVDHCNPSDLAATAFSILTHPDRWSSMWDAALREGPRYDWSVVGRRYAQIVADGSDRCLVGGRR